ncbi:SEL1-like repeat protein [Acinetobacter silvestris]|uniref:Sel1 repeat family protein n=1 Tax=Acinetobacter silvestris TaxID=1977882 RepID=A0A1Y3CLW4_9GAMM|nr:hypothetical protein B9T28_02875 [Acinetobacter silvestris]
MFAHLFKCFQTYAKKNSIQPQNDSTNLLKIQKNDPRNIMWGYLRAALRGDKEAQYKMGMSYLNGQLGLDRSYSHAEKWLEQAAHQGHQHAKKELQDAYNKLAFS